VKISEDTVRFAELGLCVIGGGALMAILIVGLSLLFPAKACAESSIYLELGVGYDYHIDEGRNPQSVIRLRWEAKKGLHVKGDKVILEYNHHSSVRDGYPFNRNPEDLTDQLSLIYSIPLN
jgi:hypothetical protein